MKKWVCDGNWKRDVGERGGVMIDWFPKSQVVEKEEVVKGVKYLREVRLGKDYEVSFM